MENKLKKVEVINNSCNRMRIVTEKEYEIHYYEIDCEKKLLITSLMNFFSDVAIQQSENLGVGLGYLKEKGTAWVIYKWDIHLKRYPMFNEKIRVRTMPYSFRKFYAYRTFEVLDEGGEVIADANSLWFFIDTKQRKSIRITDDMYNAYGIDKSNNKVLGMEKVGSPKKIDSEENFNIRYTDIDTNQHVNNVKYVDWALETVPMDVVNNYELNGINIIYEKELTYGESIKVATEIEENEDAVTCIHEVKNAEGKAAAKLKTIWNKK